ncbi:MAG: tyrosine-type recombinase/integrase [Gammaproteobacteria bacterium]|nr:tyrosine-type recombinase/integrase [Gammaproteobacteria bacterium]
MRYNSMHHGCTIRTADMPKLSDIRITDKTVKNAKPKNIAYDIRDATLRGFILKVQPTGSKAFYAEWGRGKRSRIGDAALITVTRAREIAAQRIADAKRGEIPQPQIRNSVPTLKKFIDTQYETWALTQQKSGADNVQRIRGAFAGFMDTRIDQLSAWAFEQWKAQRKANGTAPATINRDLTMVRAAMNNAVEWGLIQTNPLTTVKALKGADVKRVRFLSDNEEKRLMTALNQREATIQGDSRASTNNLLPIANDVTFTDYLKPMVLIAMNTGLRFGELTRLRWIDISLTDAPMLTVQAGYAKTGETRHIPLNKIVRTTLQTWKAQQANTSGLVFVTKTGQRVKNLRKVWIGVLVTANIKNFKWHDLRHHFASKLVTAGADLNTVRELLGHGSLDMTLRYAHLAPEHKAAAVALLDG